MLGTGLLQGLAVTAQKSRGQSFHDPMRATRRWSIPRSRPLLPEAYRNFPFLVSENADDPMGTLRCVACQICEKECPPQCIYIEKSKDKKPDANGKMQIYPAVFDIDTSVCMSCQICVEVCPFDAIKMDHVFEIATGDRFLGLLLDREQLAKPNSYFHRSARPRPPRWTPGSPPTARPPRRRRRPPPLRRLPPKPAPPAGAPGGAQPPAGAQAANRMNGAAPIPDRLLERAPQVLSATALTGFLPEPWRWLVNSRHRDGAHPGRLRPALRVPDPRRAEDPRPGPEPARAEPDGALRPAPADRRRDQDADQGGYRPARRRPSAPFPRSGHPARRRPSSRSPSSPTAATWCRWTSMPRSSISSRSERRPSWRSSWPAGRATTSTRSSRRCAPWRSSSATSSLCCSPGCRS